MAKKKPTVDDVIRGALPLVENEDTWTTHQMAKDHRGFPVLPTCEDAVRFCAVGALEKAAFDLSRSLKAAGFLASHAVDKLEKLADGDDGTLAFINDTEGREAVVALFKKALAA